MSDQPNRPVSSKRAALDQTGTEDPEPKRQNVVASKIHGIAPIRRPRVGPQYQAVIPELQTVQVSASTPAHVSGSVAENVQQQ
jgi:hypothetical protein